MKTAQKIAFLLISSWSLAGLLSSCHHDPEIEPAPRTHYQLTEEQSVATWKGYLDTGYFNEGTLAVRSEALEARNGQVVGGTFVLPLASLTNTNLPADQKPVLIHHLQSTDFFNMALYPNLRFTITQVAPYAGNDATAIAGANYRVTGDLTLLGQAHSIPFPAKIDLTARSVAVQADVAVDRTRWGLTYATDPTLPADKRIRPEIALHLDVRGVRQ